MVLLPEEQIDRLVKKVKDCQETKFYGTVTLYLSAGNLLRFETTQTEILAPQEGSNGSGRQEARATGCEDQEAPESQEQEGQARP